VLHGVLPFSDACYCLDQPYCIIDSKDGPQRPFIGFESEPNTPSDAHSPMVQSCGADQSGLKQINLPPPVHLALEGFELCKLNDPVTLQKARFVVTTTAVCS
jgi:hypothetical protein